MLFLKSINCLAITGGWSVSTSKDSMEKIYDDLILFEIKNYCFVKVILGE